MKEPQFDGGVVVATSAYCRCNDTTALGRSMGVGCTLGAPTDVKRLYHAQQWQLIASGSLLQLPQICHVRVAKPRPMRPLPHPRNITQRQVQICRSNDDEVVPAFALSANDRPCGLLEAARSQTVSKCQASAAVATGNGDLPRAAPVLRRWEGNRPSIRSVMHSYSAVDAGIGADVRNRVGTQRPA
jgi:hypothetical protein